MSAPIFPALENHAGRIAVIDGTRTVSYEALRDIAARIAVALRQQELPENARVAALLPNGLGAVAAFIAVSRTGHSYLPLNVGLRPRELGSIFRRSNVRAVLCMQEAAASLDADVATVAVDALLASDEPTSDPAGLPDSERDPASEFLCLSTSGSSGEPRLVVRSVRAVQANTQHVAAALELSPEDRFLAVVPFWHANGFSNCLLTPLAGGASIVTMSRFLPRQALETIAARGVTVVIASPFIYKAFAQYLAAGGGAVGCEFGRVRTWISSGAALPAPLDRSLRDFGIRVRQLYGSSETGTLCLSDSGPQESGCVGRPVPGVEIRIVDERGQELAAGAAGEVEVRSAALFDGYVGDASGRAVRNAQGYYQMGDVGRWNGAGELTLLGRLDAMINVAGVKVDPREVQSVLEAMPQVGQALVHGASDAAGLQQIRALVVAERETTAEEVLAYCRSRLAEYKLPRILEFVEAIPQDLMGKTARRILES